VENVIRLRQKKLGLRDPCCPLHFSAIATAFHPTIPLCDARLTVGHGIKTDDLPVVVIGVEDVWNADAARAERGQLARAWGFPGTSCPFQAEK
jgi:hypothetical protein